MRVFLVKAERREYSLYNLLRVDCCLMTYFDSLIRESSPLADNGGSANLQVVVGLG